MQRGKAKRVSHVPAMLPISPVDIRIPSLSAQPELVVFVATINTPAISGQHPPGPLSPYWGMRFPFLANLVEILFERANPRHPIRHRPSLCRNPR
jgi:hypothetical protein